VETDVREWLQMQEPDIYRGGIFKFAPRWNTLKCWRIMLKNNENALE
jgi:hypothetical protein